MNHVRITGPDKKWGGYRLMVDEEELHPRAVTVHFPEHHMGDIPTIELELDIIDGADISFETDRVIIPESTKQTLMRLGWTPPKEDEA